MSKKNLPKTAQKAEAELEQTKRELDERTEEVNSTNKRAIKAESECANLTNLLRHVCQSNHGFRPEGCGICEEVAAKI